MKKIIFLLALLPLLSYGQYTGLQNIGVFNFPINDTITQGDSVSLDIKYSIVAIGQPDTLKIELYPALNVIAKIPANSIFTIPVNSDGTRTIKFKLPDLSPVGSARFYINSNNGFDLNPVYFFIRSKTPDVSLVSWANPIDTTGQEYSLTLKYTFIPKTTDTLKIFIGDSVVYKGSYTKSLISFHIPNFNSSIDCELTIEGSIGVIDMFITKPNHSVSGILNPLHYNNEEIHYYSETGLEIPKPDNGFYIWKSNYRSGKSFVIN